MALFEIWRDGKIVAQTDYEQLIPPDDLLREMQRRSYTFRRSGKRYTPKRVKE